MISGARVPRGISIPCRRDGCWAAARGGIGAASAQLRSGTRQRARWPTALQPPALQPPPPPPPPRRARTWGGRKVLPPEQPQRPLQACCAAPHLLQRIHAAVVGHLGVRLLHLLGPLLTRELAAAAAAVSGRSRRRRRRRRRRQVPRPAPGLDRLVPSPHLHEGQQQLLLLVQRRHCVAPRLWGCRLSPAGYVPTEHGLQVKRAHTDLLTIPPRRPTCITRSCCPCWPARLPQHTCGGSLCVGISST